MARDLDGRPWRGGGAPSFPLRDARARLGLRSPGGVAAQALDLPGQHLVDLRRELLGATIEEAGRAIVQRQLRASGGRLDLDVHDTRGRLIEQRAERSGEDDPLARLHVRHPQMLDPAALGKALAEAAAGSEIEAEIPGI